MINLNCAMRCDAGINLARLAKVVRDAAARSIVNFCYLEQFLQAVHLFPFQVTDTTGAGIAWVSRIIAAVGVGAPSSASAGEVSRSWGVQ